MGLLWQVWFGTYSLVGLGWFLWFARFGLKAQKENQITFYCPFFSTAMLLEDPGNNFWVGWLESHIVITTWDLAEI